MLLLAQSCFSFYVKVKIITGQSESQSNTLQQNVHLHAIFRYVQIFIVYKPKYSSGLYFRIFKVIKNHNSKKANSKPSIHLEVPYAFIILIHSDNVVAVFTRCKNSPGCMVLKCTVVCLFLFSRLILISTSGPFNSSLKLLPHPSEIISFMA